MVASKLAVRSRRPPVSVSASVRVMARRPPVAMTITSHETASTAQEEIDGTTRHGEGEDEG